MIVSKSQSQATLPEERRGRVTSCKIGDSVHYHSLLTCRAQTLPRSPFLDRRPVLLALTIVAVRRGF